MSPRNQFYKKSEGTYLSGNEKTTNRDKKSIQKPTKTKTGNKITGKSKNTVKVADQLPMKIMNRHPQNKRLHMISKT